MTAAAVGAVVLAVLVLVVVALLLRWAIRDREARAVLVATTVIGLAIAAVVFVGSVAYVMTTSGEWPWSPGFPW